MNKDKIINEALQELKKYKTGTANISVGVGKTKLGIEHMKLVEQYCKNNDIKDYRFLVVAPKKSILDSWKNEFKKWGVERFLDVTDFTTYLSLLKQDTKKYISVYLDEVHSLKERHISWLNSYNNFLIGLTGTMPARGEKYEIINRFCRVRYTYKIDNAVEDNILNDYEIRVYPLKLSRHKHLKKETKLKNGKKKIWMTSEQDDYNYWFNRYENSSNRKRDALFLMKRVQSYQTKLNFVKKIISKIPKKEKKLIFVNFIKDCDALGYPSYHSKNPNSEQNLKDFKTGKIKILVAVDQLSEGVNIKDLKHIIILHSYSNPRKTSQRIGRAMRLNPDDKSFIHIMYYDNTIDKKWLKNALSNFNREKIKIY